MVIFGTDYQLFPMRPFLLIFLISPLFAISQAKNANELLASNLKKYSIQSGEISYELTGDAAGTETMHFDAYGWKSLRKQSMSFELYGIKTVQELYEVTDGNLVYRLNEADSTMTMRKDFKWSQQAAYKNPQEVSEAILFSLGGTQVADSVLLEKTCQVWTFQGKALQELWIWKGLVLKRKTKLGDRIVFSTANDIKLGTIPNQNLFTIPDYMKAKN